MKHLLIAGLIALAPLTGSAQYLQNISTSTYSMRTTLTKESDTRYRYQLQFRNEAQYNPTSIFTITDVGMVGISGAMPWDVHRYDQNLGAGFIGNVYTGPIDPGVPGYETMILHPTWFDIENSGGPSRRFGGSFTSYDISNGWGLLGCSIPLLVPGSLPYYSGSTCASAGYTGWATINMLLEFDAPRPDFAGEGLSAGVFGFYVDRPAVNLVPEPSTWAMMAFGLLGLAAARRKRT